MVKIHSLVGKLNICPFILLLLVTSIVVCNVVVLPSSVVYVTA